METPTPTPDPLRPIYRKSFVQTADHFQNLAHHHTALLCIDMQYLDAADGYGLFKNDGSSPVSAEGRDYYFKQLNERVLPNVHQLQNCFRRHALEVIHVRIQALTRDGRDRSKGHKRLNLLAAPGSGDACFLEAVAPRGDEIIINKTASGVFSSTNLHYVLNNMGIEALFVVGVYTNECVETTVRDACDLGYLVTMVEDGCTTVTPELHQASIATLRNRYCRIVTTDEAIADIERYAEPSGPDTGADVDAI
ncbi:cysteine hydrolase family protein [Synoicihabitans lomoniglobus]|uniref:Cysteine hydrolase n=1 Tax=Synoicihabitans lomoniglobus TaxID=2909285 RepID=A0AAF0CQG8_9BACT|nr:cysteine hydrolase [Opitutaceae bacterium LMO-M01]WED66172.1 cysteine hydrolase [Opitutaceae bacterium LMO-M01]